MNDSLTTILDQIIASLPLFQPEFALIVGFLLAIVVALFVERQGQHATFTVSVLTLLVSGALLITQFPLSATGFSGMWIVDRLSVVSRLVIIFGSVLVAVFLQQRHAQENNGDAYTVLLAATLGMHVLCCSSNWLLVFIGIEMVSIASYVLVGYFSKNKTQAEAAMKYALFGSVCAAVMLYGLSLIYGLTGNLDFQSPQHLQGLIAAPDTMVALALLFIFVGIGFKLSFVPFHLWSPDVYQGAPTAITAFLSTVPKIAALIVFTRLYHAWAATEFYFSEVCAWFMVIVAIASMLIGNLAALRQQDVKRMMAYSSIGHTGVLLMAIFAYQDSFQYLLFYSIAYVAMNFAVFIFIDHLEQRTGATTLSAYAGLGKRMPWLFTAFTVLAVSLIGLPPTIGFMGKLMVFSAVFDVFQSSGDHAVLALLIVGALTAVISLFFYFRIPLYAFLRSADDADFSPASSSTVLLTVGYLLTGLVLLLGLFPSILLDLIA